jgi:alpha-beta hydrolase superfamily lysophospholipase
MRSQNISFWSENRVIHAVINRPDKVEIPIPCVIMCHGYCGFRDENGAFIYLADEFCRRNIAAVRFDFSGCGESIVSRRRGKMLCATDWVIDLYNMYSYILNLNWVERKKISVLGMSMGAMVTLSTLKYLQGLYRAIAIAPVNNGFEWLRSLWVKRFCEEKFNDFLNKTSFQTKKLITEGIDEMVGVENLLAFSDSDLKVYLDNARIYPLTVREASWSSAENILYKVNSRRELLSNENPIPVLFIHGDNDTLVDCQGTIDMHSQYQYKKELKLFKGIGHGLLFEKAFRDYVPCICQWILD